MSAFASLRKTKYVSVSRGNVFAVNGACTSQILQKRPHEYSQVRKK